VVNLHNITTTKLCLVSLLFLFLHQYVDLCAQISPWIFSFTCLDSEADQEYAVVHVRVEVEMHFIQLLLHFKLHHTDPGARVGSGTTDDFEYVLVGFPIRRLNLVRAELLLNSIQLINGKLDALVNLLSMQVHHLIDVRLSI